MAREVLAADIGGTHARFAIAVIDGGRVVELQAPITMETADHVSLQTAWQAVGRRFGRALPTAAAIAVACPIGIGPLKMTNNPWIIQPASLHETLAVDDVVLINDFAAVAHAVAQLGDGHFEHVSGPDTPLPDDGIISVVGPGTGLGVAQLMRWRGGHEVISTEGGHVDFAPLDALEDRIVARLRQAYRRVSAERIVSGPGLGNIYAVLAEIEGRTVGNYDDPAALRALWTAALDGGDSLVTAALERFCLSLGAFVGDMALAHGATGVVIGGGLVVRLGDRLAASGFASRFAAKGRFEAMMSAIPVKRILHPQPGLFGAAAAFAAARLDS